MRLFLFAIGGTGARVLKSVVMLAMAGVRPLDEAGNPLTDFELVPVMIDPHRAGADNKRTEALLADYRQVRQSLYGSALNAEGFFAMPITNLRDIAGSAGSQLPTGFALNLRAVENKQFSDFIGFDSMTEEDQALTQLLFAPYQLSNKMNIGFVGSPNIGAVALTEVCHTPEFKAFAAAFRPGDRIFFVSSIFGGTGAAGFPILVKNIRQAFSLDGTDNRDALARAPIGGLTVLPYFNLEQKRDDDRIQAADFIVKTQSALHYYNTALTGERDAQVNAIFYLGDKVRSLPYRYDPGEHGQLNNAHLVELVGALAPFKFASLADSRLSDLDGNPLPRTAAFEYALANDTTQVHFADLVAPTRALIYKPLVALYHLRLFLNNGFEDLIGQGFTLDKPRLTGELTSAQFYRTLKEHVLEDYARWLGEMDDNMRSVQLFDPDVDGNMTHAVKGVDPKKGWVGRKSININTYKAAMNRLSMGERYANSTAEQKLLDLFYRAAMSVIDSNLEPL